MALKASMIDITSDSNSGCGSDGFSATVGWCSSTRLFLLFQCWLIPPEVTSLRTPDLVQRTLDNQEAGGTSYGNEVNILRVSTGKLRKENVSQQSLDPNESHSSIRKTFSSTPRLAGCGNGTFQNPKGRQKQIDHHFESRRNSVLIESSSPA